MDAFRISTVFQPGRMHLIHISRQIRLLRTRMNARWVGDDLTGTRLSHSETLIRGIGAVRHINPKQLAESLTSGWPSVFGIMPIARLSCLYLYRRENKGDDMPVVDTERLKVALDRLGGMGGLTPTLTT
jgi:hypothetical protein